MLYKQSCDFGARLLSLTVENVGAHCLFGQYPRWTIAGPSPGERSANGPFSNSSSQSSLFGTSLWFETERFSIIATLLPTLYPVPSEPTRLAPYFSLEEGEAVLSTQLPPSLVPSHPLVAHSPLTLHHSSFTVTFIPIPIPAIAPCCIPTTQLRVITPVSP